jgi:hypothetical protein
VPGLSDASAPSDQSRSYDLARDILAGRGEFSPAFESEHRMIRLSVKLFNKTPADLPPTLRNQVRPRPRAFPAGTICACAPPPARHSLPRVSLLRTLLLVPRPSHTHR